MPQTTTLPKVHEVLTEFYRQSAQPIVIINEERRILGMNPAAERLTGFAADEVAEKAYCPQLFRCHDADGCRCCAGLELFERELERISARYQLTRRDGKDVRVVADYAMVPMTQDSQRVARITMEPVEILESDWLEERRRYATVSRALGVLLGAVLLLFVAASLMAWNEQRTRTWMSAGTWKQLHVGTPIAMNRTPSHGVIYGTLRVGEPLAVVSGTCSADGATVLWDANAQQFVCPQDGSAFSVDGKVLRGPAAPLLASSDWRWKGETLLVRLSRDECRVSGDKEGRSASLVTRHSSLLVRLSRS
jgi:PAS domain S-box-containing protein